MYLQSLTVRLSILYNEFTQSTANKVIIDWFASRTCKHRPPPTYRQDFLSF